MFLFAVKILGMFNLMLIDDESLSLSAFFIADSNKIYSWIHVRNIQFDLRIPLERIGWNKLPINSKKLNSCGTVCRLGSYNCQVFRCRVWKDLKFVFVNIWYWSVHVNVNIIKVKPVVTLGGKNKSKTKAAFQIGRRNVNGLLNPFISAWNIRFNLSRTS